MQGTAGQKLRLRVGPGLNEDTLRIVDDGTRLRVLEGPTTADGYDWWKVQTDDGLLGWTAGTWLVPVAP